MHSENGVQIDFEEVHHLVDSADVFMFGFGGFSDRLLVDKRSNAAEAPLVQVVEPLSSPRARLAWLTKRRPSLGEPEAFTFIPWPHSVNFIQEAGIWQGICDSAAVNGDLGVGSQADLALKQLENLDRAATLAILAGEGCLTLWPHEPED